MSPMIDIFGINDTNMLAETIEKNELYCFFGYPARHSLSPKMYNHAFEKYNLDKVYYASSIPSGKIREAMYKARLLNIKGMNISMPHKESVLTELDEIDELALLCGSVNTVVSIGEKYNIPIYKGYNTDAYGAVMAIKTLEAYLEGKDAVILGSGGAAKAIVAGLAREGMASINIFVRNFRPKDHSLYASKIANAFPGTKIIISSLKDRKCLKESIGKADILINATNVGMGEYEDISLIPDETFLHSSLKVMDVIYNPEETMLLKQARSAGSSCINGLPMLLHQGEAAFKLFTGIDAELSL